MVALDRSSANAFPRAVGNGFASIRKIPQEGLSWGVSLHIRKEVLYHDIMDIEGDRSRSRQSEAEHKKGVIMKKKFSTSSL